jgi:hypothetical protein
MLGFVKRTASGIHDKRVQKILYLTIVWSQLAYSSQVWAPQTVNNILTIERLQRRASKFILSLPYKTSIPYKKRLATIGILPLCYWHEYLGMVYLHKCLINNSDNNISIKIPTRETRNTSSTNGILLHVTKSVVYDPWCFGVITTRHDRCCFGHIKNTMNIEEHYIGDED